MDIFNAFFSNFFLDSKVLGKGIMGFLFSI